MVVKRLADHAVECGIIVTIFFAFPILSVLFKIKNHPYFYFFFHLSVFSSIFYYFQSTRPNDPNPAVDK